MFLISYVYYLGQFVLENLVNQSKSFTDVVLNVDTNETQNLELLFEAVDFAKMDDLKHYEFNKVVEHKY